MTRMFLGIPMWADEERDEMGAGKALLWGEAARRQLPFLEDIQKAQVGAALCMLRCACCAVLRSPEVCP